MQNKKIIDYAIYMEKQYKMLEDKLKKRTKMMEVLKTGGNADSESTKKVIFIYF